MKRILLEGPAVEPVSLPEMKAHLRLDGSGEDDLLGALVAGARIAVEREIRRALVAQRWRALLPGWPRDPVPLPVQPAHSVEAVRTIDVAGAATLLGAEDFAFDAADGSVTLLVSLPPVERLEIDFTAGYGSAAIDVPQPLRQAIRLIATHWFEHRSAVTDGMPAAALPLGHHELLAPYRRLLLC